MGILEEFLWHPFFVTEWISWRILMISSRLLTNINFPCHYWRIWPRHSRTIQNSDRKISYTFILHSFLNNALKMPVLLSSISKTNIILVWRFFLRKIARTGSRFTRRKWNYYLWVRRARTDWKTSTTPSYCIRSKTMLSVMKTPVRPTPALQWTVIGPSWPNCSLVLWTCPMKSMKASPDLGTPEKDNVIKNHSLLSKMGVNWFFLLHKYSSNKNY